jgi:membrane fusion protein, multidrug efflux system
VSNKSGTREAARGVYFWDLRQRDGKWRLMAVENFGNAVSNLQTLFNVGAIGALSDGQLLDRFATGRGEPRELAFAALVERHGPFVLRVCRCVLRDEGAAEDAFQATFMALARKAGSLWARDSLAPWLHQAAYRAASHDRSATLRRQSHEQAAAALRPESMAPPHHGNDDDLGKIIHEEIDRLPGRFRVAVVLCDLDGRTHEQAARHLGCAVGTIKSRLARARKRLRGRLERRGVAPAPALALAAATAGGAARAAVPTGLAESTVVYAATASAVSRSVAVISEGVLKSMFLSKVRLALTAAALFAALAAGAFALAQTGIGRAAERRDGDVQVEDSEKRTGRFPTNAAANRPIPIAGPQSQNPNEANAAETNSSQTRTGQERRKIVLTSLKTMDVPIVQQYVCRIRANRQINVRALENGLLNEIKIEDGQDVKKGDLMFKIVPVLGQAKPDADSAEIIAPFDGIVGSLNAQRGSAVKEGDILTTLSVNSVISAYFNVPEQQYLEYMAERPRHEADKIELVLANQTKFAQPGKLSAIDAKFNNETGTIAFRADFPNPQGLLRHGQTGNVVIHGNVHDAIVIPSPATYEVKDKRYVYVVDKDDVAHRREIVPQHEMDDVYVIKKGVGAGDRIVLEGIRQVRDGDKVEYEFRPLEEVIRKAKNQAE